MKKRNTQTLHEVESVRKEFETLKAATEREEKDFILFLNYCSERLNKGDSVQAIWNDYQNSVC